jgi:SCY1-like protein 1
MTAGANAGMDQLSNTNMPGGFSHHIGEPADRASTLTIPEERTPNLVTSSRGKGLQLGGGSKKAANTNAIADFAKELEDEIMASNDNPWGNDDLMDVNADQDDWSEYEVVHA